MATHSSILAWKIPWTEEPGRLQFMWSQSDTAEVTIVVQSCPMRAIPWTVAHQALLSTGFPRQDYWSVLPFPPPGDLLDPRNERVSPA